LEDTTAGLLWASRHASEWGGDASRLALGGDSAGGNLSAVVANKIGAGEAGPALRALLLLYPVTDRPGAGFSYTENATGFALEAEAMHWFWKQYAPEVSADDPEAYPLRVEHVPALPPTFIATAEYDVLRDDGMAYAVKLKEAGIAVTHLHAPDMHHNFPVSPSTVARFPQCVVALCEIAGWLRHTLHSG
jgi:acetyl esterase